jgi:hypothetical protein
MRHGIRPATAALVAIATGLAAAQTSGQAPPSSSPSSIKRTADGKPNLAGVWQGGGVSLLGEPGSRPPLPPPAIPPPPREPLAYQPWAVEKNKQLTSSDDPIAHCLLPGVPRVITMPMPLEIVQTPQKIVILYEAFRAYRIIPINDQLKHPDDLVPTWMGDSVGRWEGDTLVVDVTGFNDKTWLTGGPSVHSEDLHVVERYRLAPDGTIAYTATVEDPKALTKPWVTGVTLRTPPNARVEEYECIENNQDLAHMPPSTLKK